jgi:hypothetical protein
LDQQRYEVIVDKEEIDLLPEQRVLDIQAILPMIKEPMSSIEVVYHHRLVLRDLSQEGLVIHLSVFPHLQDVDYLADVVPRGLHEVLESDLIHLELLIFANELYSTHNGLFGGSLELQVITVPQQTL